MCVCVHVCVDNKQIGIKKYFKTFDKSKSVQMLAIRAVGCVTIVKAMDCRIIVIKFELQPCYYVHFRANTLGKSMNPLSS